MRRIDQNENRENKRVYKRGKKSEACKEVNKRSKGIRARCFTSNLYSPYSTFPRDNRCHKGILLASVSLQVLDFFSSILLAIKL